MVFWFIRSLGSQIRTSPSITVAVSSAAEIISGQGELENWLRRSVINWAGETDSAKQARILRNKKRILQVDSLLTPDQRIHAVRELDEWIEIIDSIIMEN